MTGVSGTQCAKLIAENSVIADSGTTGSTRAVVFTNCGSTKLFNNQDDFGTFMRGYNTVSGLSVKELADAVQDVLLPI